MKATCKCGCVKLTGIKLPPGCSFQMGCPVCKGTAEVRA